MSDSDNPNFTPNSKRTDHAKLEIFNQQERMYFFLGAVAFLFVAYSQDLKKIYLNRNI